MHSQKCKDVTLPSFGEVELLYLCVNQLYTYRFRNESAMDTHVDQNSCESLKLLR